MLESQGTLEKALEAPVKRLYTYEELPETNQPCEFWDGERARS